MSVIEMKPENKFIRDTGKRIRKLREEKGWSQEQLALEAGVDNSHLGKLERGEGNPTIRLVYRIAEALGVEVRDVLAEYSPRTKHAGNR
ncbi:MAG TPA: helix-turn-helix transcriptional regulator [Candidatus Obscuribacterales bacterium]